MARLPRTSSSRTTRTCGAVENEAFCLRLAAKIRLPVAECAMGRAEDIDYMLVKMFDRATRGRSLRRIHQEDFCQAAGHVPALKYESDQFTRLRGPGLKDCIDVLRTPAGAFNSTLPKRVSRQPVIGDVIWGGFRSSTGAPVLRLRDLPDAAASLGIERTISISTRSGLRLAMKSICSTVSE